MEQRHFFKINLNKYGDLKKQQEVENKTFLSVLISFVVISLIFGGIVYYFAKELDKRIDSRTKLLADIRSEIKQFQESGEYLSTKDLERIAATSTERIFWAKKLVALSEKTDDKIAITHFTFKRGTLSLYGITQVEKDKREFDSIDKFITSLKENPQISADFPEITFIRSNRDKEKDVDILRFQVDCIGKENIKREK